MLINSNIIINRLPKFIILITIKWYCTITTNNIYFLKPAYKANCTIGYGIE